MNEELLDRCSLFYETRAAMDGAYRYTDCFTVSACAAHVAASGKQLTATELKELRRKYNGQTGPLSMLRAVSPAGVAVMAVSEDADAMLAKVKAAYKELRNKFIASDYTAIAAVLLAVSRPESEFESVVSAARAQFDAFKARHRFRTDSTNIPVCLMLAMRTADPSVAANEAEACFNEMRKTHHFRCRWSMAETLTLDPRGAAEKCAELFELKTRLKTERKAFSMYYELAALSFSPDELKEKADDALAIFDTLSGDRKFNGWRLDNGERLMTAYLVAAPSIELLCLALTLHIEKRAAQAAAASA